MAFVFFQKSLPNTSIHSFLDHFLAKLTPTSNFLHVLTRPRIIFYFFKRVFLSFFYNCPVEIKKLVKSEKMEKILVTGVIIKARMDIDQTQRKRSGIKIKLNATFLNKLSGFGQAIVIG